MPPAVRKIALAAHLTASVGWVGAAFAYLALDVTVATSADPEAVRAAWISMGVIAPSVIVPLAFAASATGLLMSLGTKWGLIRHWWVVISLVLTSFATLVLVIESGVISSMAAIARDAPSTGEVLMGLPNTLPHSIGGLLVLLIVQVLNIVKPQGVTPYGWRKQQAERRAAQQQGLAGGVESGAQGS